MPRATSAVLFQENIVPGGSQCKLEMLLLLLLVHRRRTRTLRVEAPLTPGKGPHHVKLGDCRPPSRGAGREYLPLAEKLGVCSTCQDSVCRPHAVASTPRGQCPHTPRHALRPCMPHAHEEETPRAARHRQRVASAAAWPKLGTGTAPARRNVPRDPLRPAHRRPWLWSSRPRGACGRRLA